MTSVDTRRLPAPVDLLGVAGDDGWVIERNGVGVAGRGLWRRVSPAQAMSVLGDLGPHVVAIGARPFDRDAAWDLAIPAYQVRVDTNGDVTETIIDDAGAPPEPVEGALIGPVRCEPVENPEQWCDAVAEAVRRIRAGSVDKVVLCREMTAVSEATLSALTLVRRLADRFPGCYCFSVDGVVGASPELLVERDGETVRAEPMAGTTRRSREPDVDEQLRQALFDSPTYRHEHQLTIDMVHDTLLSFTSYLDDEPEPHIVTLANVAHLATRVQGALSSPPASVLELQDALHPTPAVSGRPRAEAIGIIDELELSDRGRYGGTVGWVDGQGNGTWAVTIRCAQIDSDDPGRARIHAGCGLVADSDPTNELAESEAKLQAIISVLES